MVPGLPAGLRVESAFRMPAGWRIGSGGVSASGGNLVMTAIGPRTANTSSAPQGPDFGDARNAEVWVVDGSSGRVHRYPRVDPGWVSVVNVPAAGWLVRQEKIQEPRGKCSDPNDCWVWKLFAQQFPDGAPRLLAQSERPVRQALVPFPVTNGQNFAWQQGDDDNHGATFVWHPGDAAPTRGVTDAGQAVVSIEHDYHYEERHSDASDGGSGQSTIYRYRLDGSEKTTVTTVTDKCLAKATTMHHTRRVLVSPSRRRAKPTAPGRRCQGTHT